MTGLTVILHPTGTDGLPAEDALLDGRAAFLWGGEVFTGMPVDTDLRGDIWETSDGTRYGNVTHWLEFPTSLGNLTHGITR